MRPVLVPSTAAAVRTTMARAILTPPEGAPSSGMPVGQLRLHPHQVEAVHRLRAALAEIGGALLADEVGLGKTYVALALMKDARDPLLVAPAGLRDMWRGAIALAGLACPILSLESLSAGRRPAAEHDLVVVDEAHHARNPRTRRYAALAALCARARVLLLSATPVHNHSDDLRALLALFLGSRAGALGEADHARCIVRRTHAHARTPAVPRVDGPHWIRIAEDDEILDALLALPPPVPPLDGGDGGALVVHGLVRLWASSAGALRAGLRRRLVAGTALASAVEHGHHPARAELRRWIMSDDAVQLDFPELLAPTPGASRGVLDAIRSHLDGLRALLTMQGAGDPDRRRAEALAALRAKYAGERIVAFSQFAETVAVLFRLLAPAGRVGLLTARAGRVAGGPLARREMLSRFAPAAHAALEPRPAERIDLLLTTDLLSEGVNLQDASVVVHLDLPWTPARLEQRVGRVARLGSRHERVAVHALAPPASAGLLLRVEERLRAKLQAAARAVGVAGAILPGFGAPSPFPSAPAAPAPEPIASPSSSTEDVRHALAGWLGSGLTAEHDGALVAAVRAPQEGCLILLGGVGAPFLAAGGGGELTDDPAAVARVVAMAVGDEIAPDPAAIAAVERRIGRFIAGRNGARCTDLRRVASARARRAVIARIAAITARAPLHRRSSLAALATGARRAATAPCSAGAESILGRLAAAEMPDEAWLTALQAFGALHARDASEDDSIVGSSETPRALAVLLLIP